MIYSFADCELDSDRRELRRLGRAVHVEPQVFDLLEVLLAHRDRIVSKDELFASVWHDRIVSETTLSSRVSAARKAIGDSGSGQRMIVTLPRRGFRFAAQVVERSAQRAVQADVLPLHARSNGTDQSLRYCTTPDGMRIAVGVMGEGEVVVKASNWMNHVVHDLDNPLWSALYRQLARRRRFVHYDGRGIGLSDRTVANISFDAFVSDLETVIEGLGVEKVSLVGMSMGAATAIAYTARHPGRVRRLVLHGAFAIGRRRRNSAADLQRADLFLSLMHEGWGKPDAAFIKAFACIYFPHASDDQIRWFTDLQHQNVAPETAVRIREACDDIDVTDLLRSIRVPVLVTHSVNDQVVPVDQGRLLASLLPDARFLPLNSSNHMILDSEPESERLAAAIEAFLDEEAGRMAALA